MGTKSLIRVVLLASLLPWGCNRYISTWSPETVPLGHRVVRSKEVVKKEVIVRPSLSSCQRHLLKLQVTQVKHCEGWHERAYRKDNVEHRLDPHEGSRGYTCLALPAGAALALAGGVMLGAGLAQDSTPEEVDDGPRIVAGGGILLGLGLAMVALCPIDYYWPRSAAIGGRREGPVFTAKEKHFTFSCGQQPYAQGPLQLKIPAVPLAIHASTQALTAGETPTPGIFSGPQRSNPSGLVELDLVRWLAKTWSTSLPDELYVSIGGQSISVPLAPALKLQTAGLLQQTRQTIDGKGTQDLSVELGGPGHPLLYRALFQCRGDFKLVITSTSSFTSVMYGRGSATAVECGDAPAGEHNDTPAVEFDWLGERAAGAPLPAAKGAMSVMCRREAQGVLQVRADPGAGISLRIKVNASPL